MDDATLDHADGTDAAAGTTHDAPASAMPDLPADTLHDAPAQATHDAPVERVSPSDAAARLAPLTFASGRAPERTLAWLHVVTGSSAQPVSRAVLELSARFLSGGERVLIVDGGPRLALHRQFQREGRWGLVECLSGDMPVLGLVQDTGRPGLYLLAHGAPARRTPWAQLSRLLDEAQPHFGRAIVAIDPDAPAAIGEALAGWHLEGWWAERGRGSRTAVRLADRLGIHLSELELVAVPEARLELLDDRLRALAPMDDSRPGLVESAAFAEPDATSTAPVVLACDLHVRERLRFLLWMRRVQGEGRPDAARAATADNGVA